MRTKVNTTASMTPGMLYRTIMPSTYLMTRYGIAGRNAWVSIGNPNEPWDRPWVAGRPTPIVEVWVEYGTPGEDKPYVTCNIEDVGIVEDTDKDPITAFTPHVCPRCEGSGFADHGKNTDTERMYIWHDHSKPYKEQWLKINDNTHEDKGTFGEKKDATRLTAKQTDEVWRNGLTAHDDTSYCSQCSDSGDGPKGTGEIRHARNAARTTNHLVSWSGETPKGLTFYGSFAVLYINDDPDVDVAVLEPANSYDMGYGSHVVSARDLRNRHRSFVVPQYNRWTREMVALKYPRLLAHMICESLGYFSPSAVASALCCYLNGEPCYCEWYDHMARFNERKNSRAGMWDMTAAIPFRSFTQRKYHKGSMSSYPAATELIKGLNEGTLPNGMLASWF